MADHDFNRAILSEVSHRPWPLPASPWVMTQTWHALLFAHWPMAVGQLRQNVPAAFELDVFDGMGWVGVVPFQMTNVTARGLPSLPWISEFPELNVRTYVRVADRPGVYFFSLDAGRALAVHAARSLLNLPYYRAAMSVTTKLDQVHYQSRRTNGASSAQLVATYEPTGPPTPPARGTLEHFLTERYCLYNLNRRGVPYRLDIHHPRWPLQSAEAHIAHNTMADAAGLRLPAMKPLLHFSRRQDMVAWAPTSIDPATDAR
jgi:uncharacterized protein YqjF (DUF2071 family)